MPRLSEEQLQQLLAANHEDKAERKRLLGLLAQRRYRHKRKSQLKPLPIDAAAITDQPGRASRPSIEPVELEPILGGEPLPAVTNDHIPHNPGLSLAEENINASGSYPLGDIPSPSHMDDEDWLNFDDILDDAAPDLPLLLVDEDQYHVSPDPYSQQTEFQLSTNTTHQQLQLHSEARDFSDERFISVPGLDVVKAHIGILTTLLKSVNINPVLDTIWNPFARSPFEGGPERILEIPDHYHPTEAQISSPHHPVFDLLPWPKVRNKMLLIFALPMEIRPEVAQDSPENVAMRFKYDVMDATEGLRIHGFDAFDPKNWEIGQRIFDGWWWAFDMDIIHNSNMHRQRRGVDRLRLRKLA